jgi:hypothetical protein
MKFAVMGGISRGLSPSDMRSECSALDDAVPTFAFAVGSPTTQDTRATGRAERFKSEQYPPALVRCGGRPRLRQSIRL